MAQQILTAFVDHDLARCDMFIDDLFAAQVWSSGHQPVTAVAAPADTSGGKLHLVASVGGTVVPVINASTKLSNSVSAPSISARTAS